MLPYCRSLPRLSVSQPAGARTLPIETKRTAQPLPLSSNSTDRHPHRQGSCATMHLPIPLVERRLWLRRPPNLGRLPTPRPARRLPLAGPLPARRGGEGAASRGGEGAVACPSTTAVADAAPRAPERRGHDWHGGPVPLDIAPCGGSVKKRCQRNKSKNARDREHLPFRFDFVFLPLSFAGAPRTPPCSAHSAATSAPSFTSPFSSAKNTVMAWGRALPPRPSGCGPLPPTSTRYSRISSHRCGAPRCPRRRQRAARLRRVHVRTTTVLGDYVMAAHAEVMHKEGPVPLVKATPILMHSPRSQPHPARERVWRGGQRRGSGKRWCRRW